MLSVVFTKIGNLVAMGFCNSYYLYLPLRFLNGFTDVYFAIYIPVWIDQYAPVNRNSVLMSLHHIESILGTILGFGATTLISINFDWRYTFFLQAILSLVFGIILLFIKKKYFCRTMVRVGESEFIMQTNIETSTFKRVDIANKINQNSNDKSNNTVNDFNADTKSLDTLKSESKSESKDLNIEDEYSNVYNNDTKNNNLLGNDSDKEANYRKESQDNDEEIVEEENKLSYLQIIVKIITNKVRLPLISFLFSRLFQLLF